MATKRKTSGSYTPFSTKLTGSIDKISGTIKENAELMDLMQEVALELTRSIGTMHKLTVKYAGAANSVLDVVSPVLSRLPLIPKSAKGLLTKLESTTRRISATQSKTGRTIADVEAGLSRGDVTKLKGHASELRGLTRSLLSMVPK